MAAPSTDRPVTITMGAIWRFQLRPPPPGPPRLTVSNTVGSAVATLARVIFGVVYLNDCPQQPNIPKYLLALALITLLFIPFVSFPWESDAAHPQAQPGGLKQCLPCLLGLSLFTCLLAGDWWVFSVYQPNYDPAAADGLYCNKTLYTFAFWNAVWETFVIFVLLANMCKGLMCCVMMSPVPANRTFYRNV